MQIDFHHATTYAISRLAGFGAADAAKIAYASQYVDDATNDGLVRFTNGAMYSRLASAHKMLDYRNFAQLANHTAWLPFHFLPANGGAPAGQDPGGGFVRKLICLPDSPVANDMLAFCLANRGKAYALHMLGAALHVYADTWAHQRFVGVSHEVNCVRDVVEQNALGWAFKDRAKAFFGNVFDDVAARLIDGVMPLGHGAALSNPDKPFLKWKYVNGTGEAIVRDNPQIFLAASRRMFAFLTHYRDEHKSLAPADDAKLLSLFQTILDEDGEKRHARWIDEIGRGAFSFGAEKVSYHEKGEGSWKRAALGPGSDKDAENERYPYTPGFLGSDWQLFQTALQHLRLAILRDILPRYGICAA